MQRMHLSGKVTSIRDSDGALRAKVLLTISSFSPSCMSWTGARFRWPFCSLDARLPRYLKPPLLLTKQRLLLIKCHVSTPLKKRLLPEIMTDNLHCCLRHYLSRMRRTNDLSAASPPPPPSMAVVTWHRSSLLPLTASTTVCPSFPQLLWVQTIVA